MCIQKFFLSYKYSTICQVPFLVYSCTKTKTPNSHCSLLPNWYLCIFQSEGSSDTSYMVSDCSNFLAGFLCVSSVFVVQKTSLIFSPSTNWTIYDLIKRSLDIYTKGSSWKICYEYSKPYCSLYFMHTDSNVKKTSWGLCKWCKCMK